MEERNLRMPPPHLQGPLLVKENTLFGKKWQNRYVMVIPNKFQVCENEDECDKRNILRQYDIHKLDAFETMIPGSSKKFVFNLIINDIEEFYACKDAEELTYWTKNLGILISYWRRKMRIVNEETSNDIIEHGENLMEITLPASPNSPSFFSDTFDTSITFKNHFKVNITLQKTAVYHDLFTQINKEVDCPNCITCKMREREAEVFIVNPHGQVTHIKKDEGLYKYHKAQCQFFLMEQKKLLLVVFFDDRNFLVTLVERYVTTNQILQLPRIQKKLKSLGHDNVGLFYAKSLSSAEGKESLFTDDETPLSLFYDDSGNPITNPGRLLIKDKTLRRKTVLFDEDGKRKVNAARMRVKVKDEDYLKNKVHQERRKHEAAKTLQAPSRMTHDIGNRSSSFDIVIDIKHPIEAIKKEKKEVNLRSVRLSSGQIIQVIDDEEDEFNKVPVPSSSLPMRPSPVDIPSSSILSSSLPEPSIYDPQNPMGNCSVSLKQHKEVSKQESVIFDTSGLDPVTCLPIISSDLSILDQIEGLSAAHVASDDTRHFESSDTPLRHDTIAQNQKDGKAENTEFSMCNKHYSESDIKNDDISLENESGYVIPEVKAVLENDKEVVTDSMANEGDDSEDDETNVLTPSNDLEKSCSSVDNINYEKSGDIHTPQPLKFDNSSTDLNKRIKKVKLEELCHKCMELPVDDRPMLIKSKHTMKWVMEYVHKIDRARYICLIDIHLRHEDGGWKAVDGTVFSSDLEDSLDKGKTKYNIGNSIFCTWIPTAQGKPPQWSVKQALSRNSPVECEEQPIESQIAEVQPDSVEVICSDLLDDSSCEREDSLELVRPIPAPTKIQIRSVDVEAITQKVSEIKVDVKKKAKNFADTISQLDFSMEKEVMEGDIMSDEIIEVRRLYIKPLKEIIQSICSHFESVALTDRYNLGDDFSTPAIGRLIRYEFCSLLAAFLRVGMAKRSAMKSLIYRSTQVTMWNLVKDFSLSFKREFISIVRDIESSQFLHNDDMRFRFFFCELLNRSTDDGSEKLIVTWFRLFPLASQKAAKYYLENSFWRMDYNMVFNTLCEEIILLLKQLNGWPFFLHIDFEYRILYQLQQVHRESLVADNDGDTVCMLE